MFHRDSHDGKYSMASIPPQTTLPVRVAVAQNIFLQTDQRNGQLQTRSVKSYATRTKALYAEEGEWTSVAEAGDRSVRGKSLEEEVTGQSQQDFRLRSINHLVNTITVDIKYNNKLKSFYSWFNVSHVLDTLWNSKANVKMVTSVWGSQIPWQILKFTVAESLLILSNIFFYCNLKTISKIFNSNL